MSSTNLNRQYYLDWLRVIAILVVFVFHCSRFFDRDDWHVKNAVSWFPADVFQFLVVGWMMPLFFFISGASTWYSLQVKTDRRFVKDRSRRILVPLLFGIFILSPHQVYLERLTHGQFRGSFFAFLPHYFDGWYGLGGNFAWMGLHCWYLLFLFIFSLLLLPVFGWIRRRQHKSRYWVFFLVAPILLSAPSWAHSPEGILWGRMWGGWNLLEHLITFLLGYYAFSRPEIAKACSRHRYIFLTVALLLTALNLYLALNHIYFEYGMAGYFAKILLRAVVCLSSIFTLLGFAEKKLNFTNGTLRYTSEAVLPFYLLHQPLIILIGYFVIQWQALPGIKFLIIVLSSFALIAAVYVFVVKRNRVLRFLHGMG